MSFLFCFSFFPSFLSLSIYLYLDFILSLITVISEDPPCKKKKSFPMDSMEFRNSCSLVICLSHCYNYMDNTGEGVGIFWFGFLFYFSVGMDHLFGK